ncbi:glutathione S-transferase [Inquilinus ginsengisoli]|uniref:Glutathione S-transferase n=1 Tax=Inquilinus ginsengisoli TaxID=363840 RepID=A0ABU1JTJ7_9PROT|nr:glutathione S-transferase family protein [Inquilinus ginsengisoli]MDR6291940.1 glutathione S-transferase [Inquilinus ginsengisoli]
MAMTLYSGPLSLFSRKVEIALVEKGLACERVLVPFSQTEGYAPKHPAVLAANPKAQVPVLVDGALTLFDSTVILEYLEDAYPVPPLYPRDPADRARCRLVELAADEVVMPDVRPLMHRSEPPDPARLEAQEAAARTAEDALRRHWRRLDGQLAGREFFFDALTVADIAMFMTVLFALRLHGPRLDECPALAGWYERLSARPAFARVLGEVAAADRELSPHLGG